MASRARRTSWSNSRKPRMAVGASCRPDRCSPCSYGNDVVCCCSRLMGLEKYEACNEARSNSAVLNLSGHLQAQIATVRVRVRVGPQDKPEHQERGSTLSQCLSV